MDISASKALVAPVIALALWTHVMWAWMYATRIPAIMRARLRLEPTAVRGEQMATLPPRVRWKADNFNHLFEQPTVFYAVTLGLALLGDRSPMAARLAWIYVAIRIVHSLWQALVNIIVVRFALFVTMSLVVVVLTIRAALLAFS